MTWYTLEILYDGDNTGDVERTTIKNLTGQELKKFRDDVFINGLYVAKKSKATEGEILAPWRIRKIFVYMQSKKFE